MKTQDVIIAIPRYLPALTADEEVSLRHLEQFLPGFQKCWILPESLELAESRFVIQRFPDSHFRGVNSYSQLLLSPAFYERFADYQFLLIYQLDCLVFRDELEWWCKQGFDYIGAPLFRVKDDPASGFSGACNGGLSLRRVSSFLKVLNSRRYVDKQVPFLKDVFHQPFLEVRPLPLWERWKKRVQVAKAVRAGVDAYALGYTVNEDHFWSGRASYFYPDYRVAPPEVALSFAFETAPAWCFERNGRKLPFGAHAWQKWNRTFWEPHLLP